MDPSLLTCPTDSGLASLHGHISQYINLYMCVCVYVCVYALMCICVHVCMGVHVYVYMHICICIHVLVCIRTCIWLLLVLFPWRTLIQALCARCLLFATLNPLASHLHPILLPGCLTWINASTTVFQLLGATGNPKRKLNIGKSVMSGYLLPWLFLYEVTLG